MKRDIDLNDLYKRFVISSNLVAYQYHTADTLATMVDTQHDTSQPVSRWTVDSRIQMHGGWIHHSMPCRYVGWLEDTVGCHVMHAGGLPPPRSPPLACSLLFLFRGSHTAGNSDTGIAAILHGCAT